MNYTSYLLPKQSWLMILVDFANATKFAPKTYSRLPFEKWKQLKEYPNSVINFNIIYEGNDRKLIKINHAYPWLEFFSDDNSFGSFLASIESDKIYMSIINTNSTSTTATTVNRFTSGTNTSNIFTDMNSTAAVNDYNTYGNAEKVTTYVCSNETALTSTSTCKKNKEKENIKMKGFNFDFGPCDSKTYHMSMYGIAVKTLDNKWVSYNSATNSMIDVDVLNFDCGKYMFKMPVPTHDVVKGDIVIHAGKPMFVSNWCENGNIEVIDISAAEAKTILPVTNMFGFNFVTKIVSLFNFTQNVPTPEQPFGNMLPLLLMNDNDTDFDPMMLFLMNNNGAMTSNMNPMMLYMLANNSTDKNNMLPLMLMMNNMNTK